MGEKVPVEDLQKRASTFFERVTSVLVERNEVRGDSYLEMSLSDCVGILRDKVGRIKTGGRRDLSDESVRRDLLDSITDIAGYAALLSIWFEELFAGEIPVELARE